MATANPYQPPGAGLGLPGAPSARSDAWRWLVCGLLLLATVVNYMDRLTTNTLAGAIQRDFGLNDQQYGTLEAVFGLAFAVGSLLFGWLVDRVGVFWLYPAVLVGWSAMGFLTGICRDYHELLLLRTGLGLFEAGHFPCGLKTVQLILRPSDRPLGNSLLQAGTALGAILAPQAIRALADPTATGGWRHPFLVIGAGGTVWVVLWWLVVRRADLRDHYPPEPEPVKDDQTPPIMADDELDGPAARSGKPAGDAVASGWPGFWQIVFSRRFLALAILVICINLNWHLWRAWLPKFLQEARGYQFGAMLNFTTGYYIAADAGILIGGALSNWLARRRGWSDYAARLVVYAGCCVLTTLTTLVAVLPAGNLLLGTMLLVGFGGLGSFTLFYTLTQDLSLEHQGKLSGSLATITWIVSAGAQPLFGWYLDRTHDYNTVVGLVGWFPLIALVAILLLWRPVARTGPRPPVVAH